MTHNNHILDLGWCLVHFEVTDMISNEVFVWVENARKPAREELAKARELLRQVSSDYFIYANVIATNDLHMRFARHFGFREVRRSGDISVQVWDRETCKPLYSH
ncbi:MAG: hypothetical protein HC888_01445 [Candidatus Competibacteraceae bacterium]|nr:hypothetical protein [Candidatus Competibacteraceae bacterium]